MVNSKVSNRIGLSKLPGTNKQAMQVQKKVLVRKLSLSRRVNATGAYSWDKTKRKNTIVHTRFYVIVRILPASQPILFPKLKVCAGTNCWIFYDF